MENAKVTDMTTASNLPAKAEDMTAMSPLEVDMYKMEITAQQIRQYIAPADATSADIGFFLALSKSLGLNPFANEVYLIPFKGKEGRKYAPVVAYQVMLDRADASGVLDGIEMDMDDEETPTKCTVTIHRKNWKVPFKRTTLMSEVMRMTYKNEPMALWKTRPRQMLEKCAVTAALRIAVPACRRMPYIEEEVRGPQGYQAPQAITAHIAGAEAVNVDVDIDYLRGQYFKWGSMIFGKDEDARHKWQEENIGKASLTDWTDDDFRTALNIIDDIAEQEGLSFVKPEDGDTPVTDAQLAAEMEAELGKDDATDEVEVAKTVEPEENGMDFDALVAKVALLIKATPDKLSEYTAGMGKTRAQVTYMLATAVKDPVILADLKKKFAAWDKKNEATKGQQEIEL